MIRYYSDPITLKSRCGEVGTIRAFNLWQFRESWEAAVDGVAQIASLSYGNDAAKNPAKLFGRITELGHLSCLEFVPMIHIPGVSLPGNSLRAAMDKSWFSKESMFDHSVAINGSLKNPATGFLVEAPIFVVRQWFRHRSLSELEMSRRYVTGGKVPFEYYGKERGLLGLVESFRRKFSEWEYRLRIRAGQPPELARKCLPVELMTKFFVGALDSDWKLFCKLRCDAHAQPEIRVFADYISSVVNHGV